MTIDELIEELEECGCGHEVVRVAGPEGGEIVGVGWCEEFNAVYIHCE